MNLSLSTSAQVPTAVQAPRHYPGGQSFGARTGLAGQADLWGLRSVCGTEYIYIYIYTYIYIYLSISDSLSFVCCARVFLHLHTHIYVYIYIYILLFYVMVTVHCRTV